MDGSGPSEGHPYAGWGVGIWESRLTSFFPDFALWGPVPVEQWDPRWLGALQPTNNTAEVTAIAEALIWLDTEAPGPEHIPATLWYDSTYAVDAITKDHYPEHNTELILKVRELLQTVSAKRALDFQKVKAHSGNHGNEQADRLANKGATGSQTNMSSRWTLPIGSPSPSDPLLTDFCWRTSYARQLAGHEAHCAIPGAAPLTSLVGETVVKPVSGVLNRRVRNISTTPGSSAICMSVSVEGRTRLHALALLALKSSEPALRMKPFGFPGLNVLRRTHPTPRYALTQLGK